MRFTAGNRIPSSPVELSSVLAHPIDLTRFQFPVAVVQFTNSGSTLSPLASTGCRENKGGLVPRRVESYLALKIRWALSFYRRKRRFRVTRKSGRQCAAYVKDTDKRRCLRDRNSSRNAHASMRTTFLHRRYPDECISAAGHRR
jgi:hypothetical protein